MRRFSISIFGSLGAALLLALSLSGCGQTGDLYFPDQEGAPAQAAAQK